uniref:Small ribosomal subunit protein mS26 n=1 Tax=Daphnia lumholtzi TaxID=42856 RepID=A0A4Y7MES7_9CRUS|nr:EOG090X0FQ9 [Daphnia lumholtzi]SVE77926.1 EOG090X0FQ9 [Daphnia lumholtzi]SVE78556.1 EOG090X0FQ9 [Daphnia lumholtzi]SVE79184.1 EOG090X0FQ9 [Daphnia lumholtzi]
MFGSSGSRVLNVINISYLQSRSKRVWVRKPLGSPMAKSKIFRITPKPVFPEDEKAEIKRLFDNYKSSMKSIRQYFFEQSLKQAESGEVAQMKHRLEDQEHERLMEENRLENEKTAMLREERLKIQAEKTQQNVLASLIKKEGEAKQHEIQIEDFLTKQMSTPFIQPENIEKAIEDALANPTNFNFALDLDGYVYRGKETTIDAIPEEKRERLNSN